MATNDDLELLLLSMKNTVEGLKSVNDEFIQDYKKYYNECKTVKEEVSELKSQVEYLDRKDRARNLIIFKFKDDPDTNKDLLKSVIKAFEDADTEISEDYIDHVKRLGQNQGNRPVLVTFMAQRFKTKAL